MCKATTMIEDKIKEILRKQYEDGERRQECEGSIWGGSGGDVKRAVAYAQDAVRAPSRDETKEQYLDHILNRLDREMSRYKEIESDKDGYGKGTLLEIKRSIESIKRSIND